MPLRSALTLSMPPEVTDMIMVWAQADDVVWCVLRLLRQYQAVLRNAKAAAAHLRD